MKKSIFKRQASGDDFKPSTPLYGDDITAHDTQIHGLMKLGQFKLVKTILESLPEKRRAEAINIKDHTGQTLLMHAAVRNNKMACMWLLKNGANTAEQNPNGKDALALATMRNHSEIVTLINQHMSQKEPSAISDIMGPEMCQLN